MEITIEELNELLQKEFERGKNTLVLPVTSPTKLPIEYLTTPFTNTIPMACRTCPKHPSNGGDGICHCTLGSQGTTTYTTTNTINNES